MHRFLVCAATALALLVPAAAQAADPPPGSTWSEMYVDDGYGPKLHADVLRPKGLPESAPTPVIMTVSPYTSHAGATPPQDPTLSGPSDRFFDFVNGARLFERGYTYVIVDLPGFGGSGGCNDWGGPREQSGVKRAVQWAAAQKWSNGRVGLYGKSYDGWTGLMALAQRPRGLAAVVSQEPVYSGYRYFYTHGIRFGQSASNPAIFNGSDLNPGTVNDTPDYLINGETSALDQPGCQATNIAEEQQDDENALFWQVRDLTTKVHGETTPLFLTQGFLEDNTKPDGAYELFNEMAGPKRAWFGMWDHVRGNDVVGKQLAMGRPGWFDEVMRFYDHYVKGVPLVDAPTDKDPAIALQGSDGTWRREASWPPPDATLKSSKLKGGSYTDDNGNDGTGTGGGHGIWTFSPPLATRAHLAGEPRLHLDATAPGPRANLAADVYDVDQAGRATLISRTASLVPDTGKLDLRMYGIDWVLEAGHRIGVLVSSSNAEWWTHVPTRQPVTVAGGTIALPFLRYQRHSDTAGGISVKLKSYKTSAPFTVDQATIAAGTEPGFATPPPLTAPPAQQAVARGEIAQGDGGAVPAATPTDARSTGRLTLRVARTGRSLVAYGTAPAGSRVLVRVMRHGRTVAARRVPARLGAYLARLRAPRGTVVATTRVGAAALRATR